jgi:DNA repair exonuclease SbcCD ATPase subunit/3',5'-cyclic AMP phosphodiesterase CpdA
MIRLKNEIKNFTNVLHVADIHIRLTQRHDEYTEAFEKLYTAIDKTPSTTLIVVAGDVLHNKSDLSPESVRLAGEFLKKLADKRPTILIAGNHDATLANKHRLDSLSPIVDALNHDNLYYLKTTDVFIIGDVLFNNYGVFDEPDKYIMYKDIPTIYKNEVNYSIALFHGPINGAVTDIGYTVSNNAITNKLFDGHQMVMLGDIHKHQVLQKYDASNDKPVIVYCGSLIQQDHGETLNGHGFVYWTLKNKKFTHVEIPNDYGFYTVEANKGKFTTDITNMPKKAKLRMKYSNCVPSELKELLLEIRNSSEVTDVSYVKTDDVVVNVNNITNINLQGVADVNYQNDLIKKYLKNKNISVDKTQLVYIQDLNKKLNDALKKEYIPKNIKWKPKTFEFDNMFSYGEGNVIEFAKMNGVMGLFANNASGKTSILSALSFCLFDKCDRAFKASHILNIEKPTFRCKFNFDINGTDFYIERKGTSDKKGNVKVDVKFWKIEDGREVELNGEARRSTNDLIRDYIGEYDDFILTVLSVQNSKIGSFIDLSQSERKELLAQFMGLTIFDKLSDLANTEYKEVNAVLKNFKKEDYTIKLNNIISNIENITTSIKSENADLVSAANLRDSNNDKLLELTKQLIRVDSDDCDIVDLEKQKIKCINDMNALESENISYKNDFDKVKNDAKKIQNDIKTLNDKDIPSNLKKYESAKQKYDLLDRNIEKNKILIKGKMDKLSKLEAHKYDPNCDFCINNVFVKDAIKTKSELIFDKKETIALAEELKQYKAQIDLLKWVLDDDKTLRELVNQKVKLSEKYSKLSNDILKNENNISQYKNKINTLIASIENFYTKKDNIEKNKKLNAEILNVKNDIKTIEYNYNVKNKRIMDLNASLQGNISEKKTIEENVEKIKQLESTSECFKLYIQAFNKDGIPYDLITQVLPSIENEVNSILNKISDFTISLNTDGKNVETCIIYKDKKWPLEMGSGMEKFISSLAIRVALINISNLPRPNFLAVDEGFGCADRDNLAAMSTLFGYLKTQFDFIWIISHLDGMKDMVDKHIEIKKENGFSKVTYI